MISTEQHALGAILAQPQRPRLLVEFMATINHLDVAPNVYQVPGRVDPKVGGAANPDVPEFQKKERKEEEWPGIKWRIGLQAPISR